MQPTGAAPVDAELWWCDYLRDALGDREDPEATDVFVSRAVPSQRRDRMVIVRRDGGVVSGVLDTPRLSFNVWATTEREATDLAALVVGLALAAPSTGGAVKRVTHVGGPFSVTDDSGHPLRLVSIETVHRANHI